MLDENLETAAKRNFVIAIETKPGLKPGHSQVVIVKATSIAKAKQEAVKVVAKKKFAMRKSVLHWVFKSVEEVPNE